MLDLEFFQLTDTGPHREHNEDSYGFFEPASPDEARGRGWLFALADGVGGHEKGEVASRVAIDAMLAGYGKISPNDSLLSALPKLVQAANTAVYEAARDSPSGFSNMATTMVACAIRYDRVVVAHAGDSRCYLIRRGAPILLTRDHTVSSEQFRLGLISSAEAGEARTSHVLTRSLGTEMFLNVETSEHQVAPGDVLLLCTDGLHHSVDISDIMQLAASYNPLSSLARKLVEMANERDGSDNVSVQLVRLLATEQTGMYRGRHYKVY